MGDRKGVGRRRRRRRNRGAWQVVEIGIEMNDFLTGGHGMQLTSRPQPVLGF